MSETFRFGHEQFTGPARDGFPLADHPLWQALAAQASDDAADVDLDQADTEQAAEWLDARLTELVRESTDLDASSPAVRERVEELADALALRL